MAGNEEIVIVGAARTPVGSFAGAFAAVPAHELGATAIKAAALSAKSKSSSLGDGLKMSISVALAWRLALAELSRSRDRIAARSSVSEDSRSRKSLAPARKDDRMSCALISSPITISGRTGN